MPLDARIQRAVLEHHVAADLLPLTMNAVHGRYRVEHAQERHPARLVAGEDHAGKLPCQGRAPAEAEYDYPVAFGVRGFKVLPGFIKDASGVAEARRYRHVHRLPRGGVQPSHQGDPRPAVPSSDAVVVESLLIPTGRRFDPRPIFPDAASHQQVQLEDVADALVFPELAHVARFVARSVEAEDQCAVFRFIALRHWRVSLPCGIEGNRRPDNGRVAGGSYIWKGTKFSEKSSHSLSRYERRYPLLWLGSMRVSLA